MRWRLGGPPGIGSYREGHLPGAVFIDLDRDLSGQAGPGGRHPLPETERFQAAMRAAGVRQDRPVVAYDDGDCLPAARAWWMLRYYGHNDVRVLDGGYRAWLAAGLTVTTADPASAPAPGDFTARPGQMPMLDAPAAAELARTGLLLDVRAAERYRGEKEPVDPVAGHIPGAVSAPAADNLTADGTFKSAAELAGRLRRARGRARRAGRRLLRFRRHRGPGDPGADAGRHPGSAVRRLLVGVDHRSRPAGGHWRSVSARPLG